MDKEGDIMPFVITNGNIVSSNGIVKNDIRIVNGKIEKIGREVIHPGDEVIDAQGCFVVPGAIDVHTHFDTEAGGMAADDFEMGSKAAIIGGTTTIIDFAEPIKGGTLREALGNWNNKARGKTYTDYAYHMTISEWNEDIKNEMLDMVKEGIPSFKMYMACEGFQLDDGSIYEALKKAKELEALVSFHCESGDLLNKIVELEVSKGNKEPVYHMKTRPPVVEKTSISRLGAIACLVDAWAYVVHLSSKEGYYEALRARKEGAKLLLETCPQYLLLNKSAYTPNGDDSFEGAKYVISPPLRDTESNEVLWNGIRDGEIQVVATDHCAFNYKGQKELGREDFTKIPAGIPGVENRFKLMYTYGVKENRIDITKLVEVLCENPAKIFGLYPKKGVIEKGSDADIVIFNPKPISTIKAENQTQTVDYNPYEGFTQYGKFEYVFLRGEMVVKEEEIIGLKPIGKYQKRNKFNYNKF